MGRLYCPDHGIPLMYSPGIRMLCCTVNGCGYISENGSEVTSKQIRDLRALLATAGVSLTKLKSNMGFCYGRNAGFPFTQTLHDLHCRYVVSNDVRELSAMVLVLDAFFGWPGDGDLSATQLRMRSIWYRDWHHAAGVRFTEAMGRRYCSGWNIADDAVRIPLLSERNERYTLLFGWDRVYCLKGGEFLVHPPLGLLRSVVKVSTLDTSIVDHANTWRKSPRVMLPELFYDADATARHAIANSSESILITMAARRAVFHRGDLFYLFELDGPMNKWDMFPTIALAAKLSPSIASEGFVTLRRPTSRSEIHSVALLRNLYSFLGGSRSEHVGRSVDRLDPPEGRSRSVGSARRIQGW